jgi:two-component system, OmpR family, sensor histidine kinase KdpD
VTGLEVIPRRRVDYRGTTLEEMDLPAILARGPELVLIDELAHTNAPGVEHAKRYEDITEALAAGIDVFSTVNVQHFESLNDRVAELTGTRVRETVPDSVIAVADEIVLVDLTPEALIGRLQAGKVYPQERVEAALNHFFRIENLAALREVALREVAEEVETKRRVFGSELEPLGTREEHPSAPGPGTQAIQEQLLALVTPDPESQRVVRRAARSSQRLGGELDLLYVRKPDPARPRPTAREREQLETLRRLASMLGAHLLVEEGDDVAQVAARVARERGTTYLLMGTPRERRGLRRLREPLHDRLLTLLPGVDLRIVADRAERRSP